MVYVTELAHSFTELQIICACRVLSSYSNVPGMEGDINKKVDCIMIRLLFLEIVVWPPCLKGNELLI